MYYIVNIFVHYDCRLLGKLAISQISMVMMYETRIKTFQDFFNSKKKYVPYINLAVPRFMCRLIILFFFPCRCNIDSN